MGYAVDYKPTRSRGRAKRQVPQNRAQRTKDIRNAVRWNLPTLEHDTTGTDTVERRMAILLLRLNRIAPQADPTGDHVMQQLISAGHVPHPVRRAGRQVFDRDELIASLRAWAA